MEPDCVRTSIDLPRDLHRKHLRSHLREIPSLICGESVCLALSEKVHDLVSTGLHDQQ